jgi:IclR family transcriptional regulator, pca regulon regulatory protein
MIAKADMIDGAAKALAVLESFDTTRQRLNATLAAERAGISRAAARRHLLTLAHLGYLEEHEGFYWLSPKVLRLSGSYLASARLPRLVQPALNRLSALTGQSFSVAVREIDEVVIVARSSPSDKGRTLTAHGTHLGARLSLYATSTGRIWLSQLSQAELREQLARLNLHRLTPQTLTSKAELQKVLREVRKQDYAFVSEEHELGVQALAVPVRDMKGRLHAALNVVVSTQEFPNRDWVRVYLPYLQEVAREWMALV